MRMMTGAILILASAVLLGIAQMQAPSTLRTLTGGYAYATAVIGWVYVAWGLIRDLTHPRRSKVKTSGDRHAQ